MKEKTAFTAPQAMEKRVTDTTKRRREVIERLFTVNGIPKAHLEDAPPLSSGDVAALFQMSERTIRLWAAKGALPHIRTLGGGRILYPADQIVALYAKHYVVNTPQHTGSFGEDEESERARKP